MMTRYLSRRDMYAINSSCLFACSSSSTSAIAGNSLHRTCVVRSIELKTVSALTGPVRRPHQLPRMVAQSTPGAALRSGLCAAGCEPPNCPDRRRTGPRLCWHDPAETPQDRRRGAAQHPARAVVAVQLLSTPGAVLCRSRAPTARISELRRTPRMTRPWTNPVQ